MMLTTGQIENLLEHLETICRIADAIQTGDVDPYEASDDISSIAEKWIEIIEEE